jgi:hypothetical protein
LIPSRVGIHGSTAGKFVAALRLDVIAALIFDNNIDDDDDDARQNVADGLASYRSSPSSK